MAAMPARTPTGMLRKMKQSTRIAPVPVQLEWRHVEGQDVADADHRARNGEAQHGAELEGVAPGEALAHQEIGGQQADGGGQRRGDGGDGDGREEGVPGRAAPDQAVLAGGDREGLDVVGAG